ncbi:MAG: N-acetylmuramoyl-L-alanine amidase, partial [candidate division KSB1 bacterium]|nr:N-acetylmuramoyl-L-alanine amidase [candidate division KSB1 bacterium]
MPRYSPPPRELDTSLQPLSANATLDHAPPLPAAVDELVITQNAQGEQEAIYHLKKGEALYSAVVVRFTGRIDAGEVNSFAHYLMQYNGITDPTRIAAGTPIRIPVRFLDEELLREKKPTPIKLPPKIPAPRGNGLYVILDAGHGGNDPGTVVNEWAEAEIAYDLILRIKRGLEARAVEVFLAVGGKGAGEPIPGDGALVNNRHEYVKVTPAYYMEDSRVALNMRIYLIEDIYNNLLRRGVSPDRIIFISIHLDYLHPSVGGAMVYFPAANERLSQFRASGDIYQKYKESQVGTISFAREEKDYAELMSYQFAQHLIQTFRRSGIPIHDYQPIRRYVYRQDQKWSPGIIRYSRVPTSILLEAANLSHPEDWARIRSAGFRQKLADAVVRTILEQR